MSQRRQWELSTTWNKIALKHILMLCSYRVLKGKTGLCTRAWHSSKVWPQSLHRFHTDRRRFHGHPGLPETVKANNPIISSCPELPTFLCRRYLWNSSKKRLRGQPVPPCPAHRRWETSPLMLKLHLGRSRKLCLNQVFVQQLLSFL